MPTTLNFRPIVDLPEWRSLSQASINASTGAVATGGPFMAEDLRCRGYQSPIVWFLSAGSTLAFYNNNTDGWGAANASVTIGGNYGTGSTAAFCPTFSPMGTLAAGNTTRKIVLSTALPASVSENYMTNRGDGLGFIVRIIGNSAGGSGKIEERRVVANTSGTTPTVYLDQPLSFTPQAGDRYEFLSGSVLFLNAGALAANQFRRYDILTNSFSSLSTTNLIATVASTQNYLIPLDEQYVPSDRNPGEGYVVGAATYDTSGSWSKNCLTATASAAGTITGQATAGDAGVVANQFRNFQVRIVEDTATPTAVGQRRRITSHTAGASPVYTLASNWTVTPSATARFVIENDTDRVIGMMGGATATYNYFISNLGNTAATANTWDTTSWAARSVAIGAGSITAHVFGVPYDSTVEGGVGVSRIFSLRGNSSTFDRFDITGGATGAWTNGITMQNIGSSSWDAFGSADSTLFCYNPHTQGGRFAHCVLGLGFTSTTTQRPYFRLDLVMGSAHRIAGPKINGGFNGANACKLAWTSMFQDGSTKIAFYNGLRVGNYFDALQLMLT